MDLIGNAIMGSIWFINNMPGLSHFNNWEEYLMRWLIGMDKASVCQERSFQWPIACPHIVTYFIQYTSVHYTGATYHIYFDDVLSVQQVVLLCN